MDRSEKYVKLSKLCDKYRSCEKCPVEMFKEDHSCGRGRSWRSLTVSEQETNEIYNAMVKTGVFGGDQVAKADAGKPRLTLVPREIIWDIAEVREYGTAKYPDGGPDNWMNVEPQRYRDAAFRHFLEYIDDPMSVDEESGILHRKHIECNLAFLARLERMGHEKNRDDGFADPDGYDDLHG